MFGGNDAFGELAYDDNGIDADVANSLRMEEKRLIIDNGEEEDFNMNLDENLSTIDKLDDIIITDEYGGGAKTKCLEKFQKPREIRSGKKFSGFSNTNTNGESIFNSFSPLDWHLQTGEDQFATKRRKIEIENAVSRTTLGILTARMTNRQRKGIAYKPTDINTSEKLTNKDPNNYHSVVMKDRHKKTRLLCLPPMNGFAWFGITSPCGNIRRYVSAEIYRVKYGHLSDRQIVSTKTSDESFFDMLDRVEDRRVKKEMTGLAHPIWDVENFDDNVHRKKGLWVDKYMPRNFLELLTDYEINRLVLLWLRLWDDYVFQRKKRQSFWETLTDKDRTMIEMDQQGRGPTTFACLPKQKILVLHGNSGVGKSCLAQVAAVQAGYIPLLLSISELQNVAELRSRLENATSCMAINTLFQAQGRELDEFGKGMSNNRQSQSGTDDKPVCFIVEGLELASADMVNFLCSWVRRSSGKNKIIRRRPVICICASIWQSATFKELRTHSLAFRVPQCSKERLQKRLDEICRLEGITMQRADLTELIHSHGCDIRLCLNTLQFQSASWVATNKVGKNSFATANDTSPVNTATKISLLNVLPAIFTLDYHEDNRGVVLSPSKRARTLLILLGQLPQEEFTRLQQIVFSNYASVLKLSLIQCRRIVDLFVAMDQLHVLARQNQQFVLERYQPFILLLIHFICAVHVSRRLQFQLANPPVHEHLRESQQVIRTLNSNASFIGHPFSKAKKDILDSKSAQLFTYRHSAGSSHSVRREIRFFNLFK